MKVILRRAVIVAVASIVVIAAPAGAGINRWTSRGPAVPGGVTALLASPFDPTVVYYTSDAGVLATFDDGDSWQPMNAGLTELHISAATIRRNDPATLYVGTTSGALFRTRDRGHLWTEIARLPQAITKLVVDSPTGNLYALMSTHLQRSTDEGATWQDVAPPRDAKYVMWSDLAAFDGRLYALFAGALYASNDAGDSWQPLQSARIFEVDQQSGALVADVESGTPCPAPVSRSFDGGLTWQALPCQSLQALFPYNGGVLGVAAYGAVYRYTDGAQSWVPVGSERLLGLRALNPIIVRTAAARARIFVAAAPQPGEPRAELLAVTEGDTAWRSVPVDRGAMVAPVADVAVSGCGTDGAPCSVWASLLFAGVATLADSASSWTPIAVTSASAQVDSTAVVTSAPNTVIVSMDGSLHKSEDDGLTWRRLTAPPAIVPGAIGVSGDGRTMYAVLMDGMKKSTDGGDTWSSAQTGMTLYSFYYGYGFEGNVAADPHDPKTAYVSALSSTTSTILYKTVDGGAHWNHLLVSKPWDGAVTTDAFDSSLLYYATLDGLMRSTDGGASWQAIPPNACTGLLADPSRASAIYAVCANKVSRSLDRGDTWETLGNALPPSVYLLFKLAINPARHLLYAATTSGVYEYDIASDTKTYAIRLAALSGNLVSAAGCGGHEAVANARFAGDCETLTLIDINGGDLQDGDLVHLQAASGDFLAAENGGASACGGCASPVVANRIVAGPWETFTIHKMNSGSPAIGDGDSISLQAIAGDYIAAEGAGSNACQCDSRLNANRAVAGPWETFQIVMQKQ